MTEQVIGKAVIQSVVDSTQLEAGVERGKKSLASLGQTAAAAGKEASAAVASIGAGADQSAGKLDAATRNIVTSIQRATAALESGAKGSRSFFESLAQQRGVSADLLKPYLDQLDAVATKQRAAQQSSDFLAGLRAQIAAQREQLIAQGQGADALLRYKAAEAGASQEASNLITQLTSMRAAHAAAAQAAQENAAAQRAAAQAANTRSSFVASLQEQVDAIGKTRAQLLELKAAQLGVADQAAPLIARLRDAEQAQGKLGNTAAQTAQQLRQVAPQVTDIVTQLAGGQAPLQILIQQGGQLKDVFGGVGPAAKALGGYVLSLITPVTLGVAAIAALAFAASQGSKELREFQNAAVLTGNAAGLSASGFTQLRDSLSGIAGSKSKAVEVLTDIARNGRIAAENVRLVGEAAIVMERATGVSIDKTVEKFARLAESPTSAAKELNQQLNFLTTSTFAQIRALEEQGKKAEAADVAERALADALKSRATGVVENVGLMEKAWRGIAGTAKAAWDAMLNVGRETSPAEKLQAAANDVARIQAQIAANTAAVVQRGAAIGMGIPGIASSTQSNGAAQAAQLQDAQERMRDALRATEITNGNAAAQAASAAATKAGVLAVEEASKAAEQYANKQTKLNDALSQYRDNLAKIRQQSPDATDKFGRSLLDPKVIAETEAGIRKAFAPDTTGESNVAQQRAAARIAAEENARLQASIDSLDFSTPTKLTDAEKKVIEVQEELKGSLQGKARAMKEAELAEAQARVETDKNRVSLENQYDAVKKAVDVRNQQVQAVGAEATSIRQLATEQAAVNENYGKSKTAIEEVRLAEIRKQLAEADAFDTFDPKYVASLRLKAEAQADFVKELQRAEVLQKSRQLDEAGRVSAEETATLQLELSLVGRTQVERDKIIAQRKIEVSLAKELASIDKLNAPEEEKEAQRAKARANARVDAENAASKAILNDWQRTADSINQSLTDALLRGFEAGKGFAQNLRDTLKNMFATLVLKPVVQAVLSPVSGALAGIGQSIGGSVVSGGGSLLGSLGSAGGIAGSIGSGLGMLGQAAGVTMSNGLIGGFGANMANIGSLAAGGEILGAVGAALPYVGIALAAASALGLFKKGGGPKTESGFGIGVTQRGDPGTSQAVAQGIEDQYKAIAGTFAKDLQVGVFTAQDPQGTALTQLEVAAQIDGASVYNRAARLGGQDKIENVGRSPEALQAAITEESERVVLEALQATNLPGQIGDYLKQLGDVDKLTGGALDAAVQKVQAAMTQRQALEQRLFDATASDAQKLAKTRDDERAATDALNLSLLEQVYRAEDLKKAMDAVNGSLDSALASYRTSAASGLSRNEAFGQIQTALAISKAGGTLPDVQKLQDAISVLSQPNQDAFRSQADFLSARDSEAALLTALKAQLTSGTVQTPAIVSDAGSTISAAQSTSTALQTIGSLLSDQGVQMQILSDASKTTARVLTDVVNGGASLSVETIA